MLHGDVQLFPSSGVRVEDPQLRGYIRLNLLTDRVDIVCSKQLYREALGHPFDEPKRWELHNINEIMNQMEGWEAFSTPKDFLSYGRQRGWKRR